MTCDKPHDDKEIQSSTQNQLLCATFNYNYTSATLTMIFRNVSFGSFFGIRLERALANFRSVSFAWKRSLGIFRFETLIWDISLWNFRLGSFAWELSFGISCFGTFAWDLSLGGFRLGSFSLTLPLGFAWKLLLGIFRLGWELSFGIFRLGTFVWDPSLGNFRLATFAWDLRREELGS